MKCEAVQKCVTVQKSEAKMASGDNRVHGSFPALSSDNYYAWKFDMKMLLIGRDVWDIVTGDEELEEGATQKEERSFKKRENQALSMICLNVSQEMKIYVRSAKTSKEAWDLLANHFEEKTLSKKIMYRRQLYNEKASESNAVMADHINKIKTIAEHLEALDDPVSEKDLVMILLSSIPNDYNNLITTLESIDDEERLTWDYVRDRILTEYERRKDQQPQAPRKPNEIEDALLCDGKEYNQGYQGDT